MTYTYRIPAAGPDSVSISPLRGGDGPAWPSSPARGLTYDLYLQKSDRTCLSLMNPCSSYLCLTETYGLQKYYLLEFCIVDPLQRSGNTYAYRILLSNFI